LEKFGAVKANVGLATQYVIKKEDEEKVVDTYFVTKFQELGKSTDLLKFYNEHVEYVRIGAFKGLHTHQTLIPFSLTTTHDIMEQIASFQFNPVSISMK